MIWGYHYFRKHPYSSWKAIFDTLTIFIRCCSDQWLQKAAYFFGLIWLSTGFYAKCFRVLRWHHFVDCTLTWIGRRHWVNHNMSPWNSSWWFPYLFITYNRLYRPCGKLLNPPGPQQKILHRVTGQSTWIHWIWLVYWTTYPGTQRFTFESNLLTPIMNLMGI